MLWSDAEVELHRRRHNPILRGIGSGDRHSQREARLYGSWQKMGKEPESKTTPWGRFCWRAGLD